MSIRPVKRIVSATPHTEGAGVKLGAPLVEGAKVSVEVVSHGKHKKLWHFRTQEEGWDRIRGHRQPYTELKITGITG